MLYVRILPPTHWGKKKSTYEELEKIGFPWGIYEVGDDGNITGSNEQKIRYWDYKEFFEELKSYNGKLNFMTRNDKLAQNLKVVNLDLFRVTDGFLVAHDVYAQCIEEKKIPEEEGGGMLLLCKDNEFYFQVRVSK